MVGNVNKIAESNDYDEGSVEQGVDAQAQQDLDNFKNYYDNAPEETKTVLNEKFKEYLNEELQKDSELNDKLSGSETKESSEIGEQDIANLNTVRSLTDVFNNYPNISSPEYRAVKKMIDEHLQDLNRTAKEVLSNSESQEGDKADDYS